MWEEAKKGKKSISYVHEVAKKQPVKKPRAKKVLYEELNRKLRDENQKLREVNESLKLEVERLQGENWELKKKLHVVTNKKPESNERKKVSLGAIKKKLKDYGNMNSAGEGKSLYHEKPFGVD